jgi:hypothetical protein
VRRLSLRLSRSSDSPQKSETAKEGFSRSLLPPASAAGTLRLEASLRLTAWVNANSKFANCPAPFSGKPWFDITLAANGCAAADPSLLPTVRRQFNATPTRPMAAGIAFAAVKAAPRNNTSITHFRRHYFCIHKFRARAVRITGREVGGAVTVNNRTPMMSARVRRRAPGTRTLPTADLTFRNQIPYPTGRHNGSYSANPATGKAGTSRSFNTRATNSVAIRFVGKLRSAHG